MQVSGQDLLHQMQVSDKSHHEYISNQTTISIVLMNAYTK